MFNFSCQTTNTDSELNPYGPYTISQLQDDFTQFRNIIETTHPSLYLYYNRDTFNGFFESTYNSLTDGMTELQFYRVLATIVSKIYCGHTNLSFTSHFTGNRNSQAMAFPFGLAFINNRAYIYQNYSGENEVPVGSEILSINNEPVSSVLSGMLDRISSDGWNETKKINLINRRFFHFYYNLVDTPDTFILSLIKPLSTELVSITVDGLAYSEVNNNSNIQNPAPYNGQILHREKIDNKTALLAITSFSASSLTEFESYMRESFQEFIDDGIENMIIDLRGNGGGDPYQSADLISYLIDSPFTYFEQGNSYPDLFQPVQPHELNFNGNVYFLINGAGFSTTGHFCSLAKYHKLGVFIGEETGGSFYCNDNSTNRALSISGLTLRIARTLYATAVPDNEFQSGRGIMPDHEVKVSLTDRISGIDRQMLYVLELIALKNSRDKIDNRQYAMKK